MSDAAKDVKLVLSPVDPQHTEAACLGSLHESILLQIFALLDVRSKCAASEVCRSWYNLMPSGSDFWMDLRFTSAAEQEQMTSRSLLAVLKKGQGRVKTLSFARPDEIVQQKPKWRFSCGVRVGREGSSIWRGRGADRLARLCRELTHLALDERVCRLGGMTDDLASSLAQHTAGGLRTLEVGFEQYSRPAELFSDDGLLALAEKSPGLRSIRLHGCCLSDRALFALAEFCPGLEEVEIQGYSECLTDAGFADLFGRCHGLRRVFLEPKLPKVSDASFILLARNNPTLEAVQLTRNASAESLVALGQNCPSLLEVRVPGHRCLDRHDVLQFVDLKKISKALTLPSHLSDAEMEFLGATTVVQA